MRRRLGNQSAFLLITALVVVIAMVAVGAAALTRSATEIQASSRFSSAQQAFHLADASVDAALVNFQGGQLNDLVLSTMVGGSYWATVHDQGNLVYLVNGHGLQGLDQRDVRSEERRV